MIGAGLVIVLLFLVIFMIIRSGSDEPKVPETKRELTSYVNDSNVTITQTTIGPVVAPQNHDETQISITNTTATIEIIKGYEGNVVNSRSYPMSTEAFRSFLNALESVGFTRGDADASLTEGKNFCPTGTRYIFEINEGAKNIQRYWATSCGAKSYKGEAGTTINLFQAQIPEYDDVVGDLNLDSSLSRF